MLLLPSADFFSKLTFSKNSFRNMIRVSISLDPDQDRHFVGPDLGPNCLQRLSADDKCCHKQGKSQTSVPGDQHMFCNYHLRLGKCDEIISVRSECFPSSISYQQNIACAYLSIKSL